MEENLKILEEIKDMFIHLKNYGYINDIKKDIDTDKAIQAIESTINRNKELEEENKRLKPKIDVCNWQEKSCREIIDEKYIPVSLVKEKIEELNKAYEDSKDENGESEYYYPDYTIRVLQELLEKRK